MQPLFAFPVRADAAYEGTAGKLRRVQELLRRRSDAAAPDAANVGASLFQERKQRRLILLTNDTNVPLVTGDQPVINLLGIRQAGSEPTFTTLYYPVSPRLAVLLPEPGLSCSYGSGPLSAKSVDELNRRISADSHAQVFGNTGEVLHSLLCSCADWEGRGPLEPVGAMRRSTWIV